MSTNGESVDPYQVFEPEYWGESTQPQPASMTYWTVTRRVRRAERETAPLVPKIVNGEIVGSKVSEGVVFNPSDEDLSRTSVHNFVGSILLADTERLYGDVLPLDDSNTDHLALSARELMQRSVKVFGSTTLYYGGNATITKDEQTYSRRATILRVVANRKNKPFIAEMFSTFKSDDPKSLFAGARTSFLPGVLWSPSVVGETQTKYDEDGNFVLTKRLRSLELVAAGAPAVAPEPNKLHGLLHAILPK